VNPLVFRFAAFLIVLLLSANASAQNVKSGVADLSGFNVDDGFVSLQGEWEFYWNTFRTGFEVDSVNKSTLIKVPGSWHRQGNYPIKGFATYRLKIILPDKHSGLSILFPVVSSAARFSIDGTLIEETGVVGVNEENYKPSLKSTLLPLPENKKELTLVVEVANFSYFSSGIAQSPQVGKATAMLARSNRANGIENFFAGSLFAMCVYQMILFFLYQRGKSYLWLALICLGVALRAKC
jgi:hypothetical protein